MVAIILSYRLVHTKLHNFFKLKYYQRPELVDLRLLIT